MNVMCVCVWLLSKCDYSKTCEFFGLCMYHLTIALSRSIVVAFVINFFNTDVCMSVYLCVFCVGDGNDVYVYLYTLYIYTHMYFFFGKCTMIYCVKTYDNCLWWLMVV